MAGYWRSQLDCLRRVSGPCLGLWRERLVGSFLVICTEQSVKTFWAPTWGVGIVT